MPSKTIASVKLAKKNNKIDEAVTKSTSLESNARAPKNKAEKKNNTKIGVGKITTSMKTNLKRTVTLNSSNLKYFMSMKRVEKRWRNDSVIL